MICDGQMSGVFAMKCGNTPTRAPRVVVCSRTPHEPGHRPLKMFTTLHFCEIHKDQVKLADLLQPSVIADFEKAARLNRPIGFKCDFEPYEGERGGAFVEFVLVTTPEYRNFLAAIGQAGILGAALLQSDQQQAQRKALGVQRLAG
jgi:hypothetical protein